MTKILVVDDDPVIRKLLKATLTRNGYDVTLAEDGLLAMTAVRKEIPDLMILDIMMPNMNGYDVCRAMKSDSKLKKVPIILLSSLDQGVQAKFLSSMGIEYLHKLCKPHDIMHKIEHMLGA